MCSRVLIYKLEFFPSYIRLVSSTAWTIPNNINIKKNNLNTHCKNLVISANVNLASRNINISEPSRNENEFVSRIKRNRTLTCSYQKRVP